MTRNSRRPKEKRGGQLKEHFPLQKIFLKISHSGLPSPSSWLASLSWTTPPTCQPPCHLRMPHGLQSQVAASGGPSALALPLQSTHLFPVASTTSLLALPLVRRFRRLYSPAAPHCYFPAAASSASPCYCLHTHTHPSASSAGIHRLAGFPSGHLSSFAGRPSQRPLHHFSNLAGWPSTPAAAALPQQHCQLPLLVLPTHSGKCPTTRGKFPTYLFHTLPFPIPPPYLPLPRPSPSLLTYPTSLLISPIFSLFPTNLSHLPTYLSCPTSLIYLSHPFSFPTYLSFLPIYLFHPIPFLTYLSHLPAYLCHPIPFPTYLCHPFPFPIPPTYLPIPSCFPLHGLCRCKLL